MRARMGLAYGQISYEHREILLRDRPKSLYDISPKGTVPVLQLDRGKVIDESIDIMKWALNQNDPEDWYNEQKSLQDEFIKINDNQFKKRLDKYKYHVRYPDNDLEQYRNDVAKYLSEYDRNLQSRKYLCGERIRLADIALMPFVRQCAHVDLPWFESEFQYLFIWLQNFKESKLFISIMSKFEVWDQTSKGVIIKW